MDCLYPPRKPITMTTRWNFARLPARFHDMSFADFVPRDEHQHVALRQAQDFVQTFVARRFYDPSTRHLLGRGLLLAGKPGTGKSLLAAITAQEVHRQLNGNFQFILVSSFLRELTSTYDLKHRNDDHSLAKLAEIERTMERSSETDLVLLDDLGAEHHTASSFAKDTVTDLVRHRFNDGLPMLVTSNLRTQDWAKVYGAPLASLLAEAFDRVALIGLDQRGL